MARTLTFVAVALFGLATSSCENGTSPRVAVHGNARFYNGATPATGGAAIANFTTIANVTMTAVVPRNGQWLLSPDKVTMKLTKLWLRSADDTLGGNNPQPVDCTIAYDKSKPGLTQIADCPFTVDTGTYTELNLQFAGTYEILINDAANGFYTTTDGIVTSPPAGGAQPWTFIVPLANDGEFGPSPFVFPTPLVVADSTPLALSVVINALQFFKVVVSGGAVTVDGSNPNVPSISAAVGTLAAVEFYSRQQIGTADSYCAFLCGQVSPTGVIAVTIYYSDATTPTMANMAFNGMPTTCNLGASSMTSPKGYMGLDAAGNLGWAMPTDEVFTAYTAEIRMARVTTIGGPTTLYCKSRTTDPAPPGGTYASGAPNIAQPANSIGTYLLVGK